MSLDWFMKTTSASINVKKRIMPKITHYPGLFPPPPPSILGSERKTDLDKAYTRIVDTIFNNILRCATEQQKNPKDVVMMENYHHMYDLLARFKVAFMSESVETHFDNYCLFFPAILHFCASTCFSDRLS